MNILNSESEQDSLIDHDKHFIRLLAAQIAGDLQVGYGDKDIVVKLLTSSLEKTLLMRDGLLERYLHTQLDIIARNIKARFNLPNELDVNYRYATHAKLNDIMNAIEEKCAPDFGKGI